MKIFQLEVDLEYLSELHDLHNDHPLAPENLKINQNMLSKYCSKIANKYGIKIGEVNKLVPNLGNKSKYIVHYRNLQLYLSLEMKLTKIHRILGFKESDWLKRYIDFNTDKRKNATNSVKLVNNVKDYVKCISKPSFVSQKIFSKNFVAIHEIKPVLTLNKPIYVGFSILDLSKYFMYEFHYKDIKSKFDAKLLFTHRDSLVYEIKTEDVCEDFYQNKNLFDFSDYPLDSKFFCLSSKKVIGKMKDEFKGKKIRVYWIKVKDVLINYRR